MMGPKKARDVFDENTWRSTIEEAVLNDDTWNVKVIMIEPAGNEQDRIYLNKFEVTAAQERRFVIKNICRTETIFMVNQLGGEKKIKDDSLRVFEEAQAFLKEKKDIPPDILALIIKHLILKMKDEYLFIKRQRLAVKEGLKTESNTMINKVEVRGTVFVKPEPQPIEIVSSKSKNKAKDEQEVEEYNRIDDDKKYNTLLRVRGEEWRDKVYIDDFPEDGPNLYVALTSFMQPNLAACLIRIGIPITAVVQVRLDPTTAFIPSSLFRATKRGQSQIELLGEKYLKFWDDLQKLRLEDDCDILKNTAFVIFFPPISEKTGLSGDQDKIYDELSLLMYDIQDLTRQHNHYLDNLHVIPIPEETPNDVLQKMYDLEIQNLPLESTNLFSVLDSILKLVSSNIQLEINHSESSLHSDSTITQQMIRDENEFSKVDTFIENVFDSLTATDAPKKKYRITYGDEYEHHANPTVIKYGDLYKLNTFHINQLNLEHIVYSTLCTIPVNKLWQHFDRLSMEDEAKVNFHVNVLLSCFDRRDIETIELTRLINILAFRKLYDNRSSLKKEHLSPCTIVNLKKKYLKRSILAEPLKACPSLHATENMSNSLLNQNKCNESEESLRSSNISDEETEDIRSIRMLFECPDISELVSASEVASRIPMSHMIENFQYFEEFSDTTAFQLINDAYNKFNCVNYKYCEVTDSLVLMFFNSHDSEGISREEWRGHLGTPVCLQDFFDFILEEHYDWIQNEENVYDQVISLSSKSESKDLKNPAGIESCLEKNDVETELLIEGSLKHEISVQREELLKEALESAIPSTTYMGSKSSKKTKSSASPTPKNVRQSFILAGSTSDAISEPPIKPFNGYDLCDRRVEAFGKDSIYFSKDETRVTSKYLSLIPINVDYVMLNVIPGGGPNEFWMYKPWHENIRTNCESDAYDCFRIRTKDNVSIYIKKQRYIEPILIENEDGDNNLPSPNSNNLLLQMTETKSFCPLILTWPNGLITETVYENNSSVLSHVKQFYSSPLQSSGEDMRCISLKGEVIIFKKNEEIEVLRPAGSRLKITKCGKRIKHDINILKEDTQSEASSGKNKKNKGKSKDKPSKASTKSSKNESDEDEKMSEPKELEFELFIDEFEIIYTNGLRQKFVNDKTFDLEKILIRTATDYGLGEIYSRRSDGTSVLLKQDGTLVVTFPCSTRIITSFIIEEEEIFPEWSEEEIDYFNLRDSYISESSSIKTKVSFLTQGTFRQKTSSNIKNSILEDLQELSKNVKSDGYVSVRIIYSIENPHFTTVTIDDANGTVILDNPNGTSITIDLENNYKFLLDDVTSADFDGDNLNICYEACVQCMRSNRCHIKIRSDDQDDKTFSNKLWLRMEDSFGKNVIVTEDADINVCDDADEIDVLDLKDNTERPINTESVMETKLKDSFTPHEECTQIMEAKSMKFFVLRRDLSCAELVNEYLVEKYKGSCRRLPWCSINEHETCGDYRSLLSILTPIHVTESEKCLMNSKLANKPAFLTYKDLKNDDGKGFYKWMRPYIRYKPKPIKPDCVIPERLPRAYILRTLERQWSDIKRDELKGAKELIMAVLKYRHIIESNQEHIIEVPIREYRSEGEQRMDGCLQEIAHRVYQDLKKRITKDVRSRMRKTITTKLPASDKPDEDEGATGGKRSITEKSNLLEEVETAADMSLNLKRYWRRRDEEYNEEQFYKYLLREGSVPPYFRNVLGGAIWCDMNNAAGEAVTESERAKKKCHCFSGLPGKSPGDIN